MPWRRGHKLWATVGRRSVARGRWTPCGARREDTTSSMKEDKRCKIDISQEQGQDHCGLQRGETVCF
jgi:hypothetical protein